MGRESPVCWSDGINSIFKNYEFACLFGEVGKVWERIEVLIPENGGKHKIFYENLLIICLKILIFFTTLRTRFLINQVLVCLMP